ncbi:hypothetical protein NPIL_436071 [Nephila pilipes]|uniref:Uncharacterized protein n=1 Tax=Nephila pilipes TaxID=299642 RepID=A0A8X6NKV3_NEPPI|nr:hypothetical protein NPIL_436071 [Nephila pilipes]
MSRKKPESCKSSYWLLNYENGNHMAKCTCLQSPRRGKTHSTISVLGKSLSIFERVLIFPVGVHDYSYLFDEIQNKKPYYIKTDYTDQVLYNKRVIIRYEAHDRQNLQQAIMAQNLYHSHPSQRHGGTISAHTMLFDENDDLQLLFLAKTAPFSPHVNDKNHI